MITAHISLYRSVYYGLDDTGKHSWPPSPKRLLGALLSGVYALDPDDPARARALRALQRISAAPPPVIDAPSAQPLGLPGAFAPKTWLPESRSPGAIDKYLDFSLLGFDTSSRVFKRRDGVALSGTEIEFHIDLECDADEIDALDLAASRSAYFGTAKDPADIWVAASEMDLLEYAASRRGAADPLPAACERWYPNAQDRGDTHGWQPNTIAWYEDNYQRVFGNDPSLSQLPPIAPPGSVAMLSYSRTGAKTVAQKLPAVPLRRSVPSHRIPAMLKSLRARLAEDGNDCGLMPLTVSHESNRVVAGGDGRCVGIALRLDKEVERQAVSDAEIATQRTRGALSSLAVAVEELPDSGGSLVGPSAALCASAWVGPAKRWYSTTPLRAFPDERVARFEIEAEVRRRFEVNLIRVTLSRSPRTKRNTRWAEAECADGLTQWWAEVEMEDSFEGPLQLGGATDRGFGVFQAGKERG